MQVHESCHCGNVQYEAAVDPFFRLTAGKVTRKQKWCRFAQPRTESLAGMERREAE